VALDRYLTYGYVPHPDAILQGVHKLPPAHLAVWHDGKLTLRRYWEPDWDAEVDRPPAEDLERLRATLDDAVREQMVADVPLGAFLSGGVDSSAVVALMQTQSPRPVKTFTVGFHQSDFNEAEHAKAVAKQLGTDHTEVYVTPAETLAVIPRLPELYDEPFGDSSQIPTFLVAQIARRHVTVSLSGDGGDEVFAGYPWYGRARKVWGRLRRVPRGLRRLLADTLVGVPGAPWDRTVDALRFLLPGSARRLVCADALHKLAAVLGDADHLESLHQRLIGAWNGSGAVLGAVAEPPSPLTAADAWAGVRDLTHALQCFDMQTYLPDDILTKVDRASMGASLEARAPYLDRRVVEFAWRLPERLKVRHGRRKWLLRQVLYRHVPRALIERPKKGFDVPVAEWLRGPLRAWAEALLEPRRLREDGFFDAALIRRQWQEHVAGERDWQAHLWNVLMFQAWLRTQ
jgi:asparagine synthase (glutamine-hydrolysing)